MAKVVKMCDMDVETALWVFKRLNGNDVTYTTDYYDNYVIYSKVAPLHLTYPEGWYYAKGNFRNKHTTSKAAYFEVRMLQPNGTFWGDSAYYTTPMSADEELLFDKE